ncbi:MAG: DUF5666 domain-containing protein [Anaerolineales bacterium]
MKKIFFALLVAALALALATPALAAPPFPLGKSTPKFTLVGKITALDATNQTITVEVRNGNRAVKAYAGQAVVLTTSTSTRFLASDGTTTTVITFADLKVGDRVSAQGIISGTVWQASRITVDLKAPCP